jgi:hypothetical protein
VSDGAATGRLTVRRLLNPAAMVWSVNIRAEWGQRVQVCCRMIADEVDGPGADEHEPSDHRDDGGADHDVAPFIFSGSPRCANGIRSVSHQVNSGPHHDVPG